MTDKEQKFIKEKRVFCFIDGIKFQQPEYFEDYFFIGFLGLLLLIALPIWIIPYLAGRMFKKIARKVTYTANVPVCNECGTKMEWNSFSEKYKCERCYSSYYS